MKTLLIVEDEQSIRGMLNYALSRAGFKILEAASAEDASQQLNQQLPDLILMDWMLPHKSGLELTRQIKRDVYTRHIPIIMLTAMAEENHKITGLNTGADDYLSKPFSPGELVARIHALLRRTQPADHYIDQTLTCGELSLNTASHQVTVGDTLLNLGPTEFRLLRFFMQHPERVYNREHLLNHAWGQNVYVEERTVDVHILRLRKNLKPFGYDRYIQTVRGTGYRFAAE